MPNGRRRHKKGDRADDIVNYCRDNVMEIKLRAYNAIAVKHLL